MVHKPSTNTDEYLLLTDPLPPHTSQAWIQEIVRNHGGTTLSRGGRRKRKYSFENTPIKETKRMRSPLEQDEYFLQYLTLRHGGNVDAAQLSLLVASGAGRGKRITCVTIAAFCKHAHYLYSIYT